MFDTVFLRFGSREEDCVENTQDIEKFVGNILLFAGNRPRVAKRREKWQEKWQEVWQVKCPEKQRGKSTEMKRRNFRKNKKIKRFLDFGAEN